ncbi:hypothetical protein [Absidia glauca]|uniref:Pre-rRNA-processing protein RIX1 n=1 Tax=Absidia glauca TaxID=4829 RepID=A0A163IWM5_ABSGL|nr:hypothetical protein [Absidia glauca]
MPVDMLAQLVSYYLNDDATIHNNLPFIMDTILTRSLLKDQESNEDLTAVRRKWTTRLNSLIQSKQATARWSAIVLIKLTCEQSPSLLFAHIRSWTGQLLGLVAKQESTIVHKAAIETLSYLFSYTSNKPELLREITTPNLPRFNQALLSVCKSDTLLPVALSALEVNLIRFPSQSRHITDQCLRWCLSSLDGRETVTKETVKVACQCLAALHHVNGKLNSSDQWKDNMLHLVGSVHLSLNRLFDTIDEEVVLSDLPPPYPMVDSSPDPMVAFPLLVRRVKAFTTAIITCLGSSTPSVVSVPIIQLIDLVCRIYNVFEGSLMREFKDKTEFTCLMSCLPALHLSANKIVSALLLSSGCHLSGYSKLFSRVLIRMLNEYKTQRTVKLSVYSIVSLCLQQFGLVFGELICKPLVMTILEDIQVTEQTVTDMAPTEIKNKSTKRKRDTLTNSDLLANSGQITQAPHDIQMAGLDSLQHLFNCFGSSMDLHTRNTIDSVVINRLLLSAQTALGSISTSDTAVKEKLYQCLLSSIMNPIEVQASALPHAIRIFSAGLNEQSHQLQAICKQSLAICNLISHPRMPPTQSTANMIAAKLNRAIQASEADPATSNTLTSTNSSIQQNNSTDTLYNSPATTSPLDATSQQPHSNTATPMADPSIESMTTVDENIDKNESNENEMLAAIEKEINSVVNKPMDDKTPNDLMATTTTAMDEVQVNIIDLTGDLGDVMEQQQVETIVTTTITNEHKDASATQTQETESTKADLDHSEKASTVSVIPLDDESDEDLDMALPDIDMAGPDTEDDDED